MDVRMFTVGPVAENSLLFRRDGSDRALIVDPGDEADQLLDAIRELGVKLEGILLTHTHFDHVGAVRPSRRRPAPRCRCRRSRVRPRRHQLVRAVGRLRTVRLLRRRGHRQGGERLELAGFEIDVVFTPGHSPGHVTFSIPDEQAIFSGDVLFQGSVGRVDLPGGDWARC